MKSSVWQTLALMLSLVALAFVVTVAVLFSAFLSTGVLAQAAIPLAWAALGVGCLGGGLSIVGIMMERRG